MTSSRGLMRAFHGAGRRPATRNGKLKQNVLPWPLSGGLRPTAAPVRRNDAVDEVQDEPASGHVSRSPASARYPRRPAETVCAELGAIRARDPSFAKAHRRAPLVGLQRQRTVEPSSDYLRRIGEKIHEALPDGAARPTRHDDLVGRRPRAGGGRSERMPSVTLRASARRSVNPGEMERMKTRFQGETSKSVVKKLKRRQMVVCRRPTRRPPRGSRP